MADMTEVLQHPAVRAYLTEVHRSVAARDPGAADGVLAGVADHIRDAAADASEKGAQLDLDALLSELGDPALIAADVEPVAAPTAPTPAARFVDTRGSVILTALLLSVGTWLLAIVGWAAGVWLLWSSQRWSRSEKIVATLWWPVLILLGSLGPAAFGAGGPTGWHLMIVVAFVGSIGMAVWLAVRGSRLLAQRLRLARPTPIARPGALGVADRWQGASIALGGPAVAVAIVAGPALASRSWAGLPVTATVAAVVLAAGIAELWISRGWRYENRVWHTGTAVLSTYIAGYLIATTISSSGALRRCGADGCVELAPRLAAPSTFVESFASFVLPTLVLHAVTAAATFRSGTAPARRLDGRFAATAIVLTLLAGTAGITVIVRTAGGWTDGLMWSVFAAAIWSLGAVLLLRSEAWNAGDRVAGIVPALVVAWLCAVGSPVGGLTGTAPQDPANPLVPAPLAAETSVILAALVTVQVAASLWLLVRAGVFRRGVAD